MPATSDTISAARGTLLSIALRLVSFLLSQLTFRLVSAATLGQASIPLELLLGTALFVGREGFRLALTKEVGDDGSLDWKKKQQQWRDQQLVNVSWLSIPAGAVVSVLALLVHLHSCSNIEIDSERVIQPDYLLWDYKLAGILYCISSFIETLSEPLIIRCMQQMDVASKAKAEGVALVMKSLSCFGCLYCSRFGWYVGVFMKLGGFPSTKESSSKAHFSVTAFGISHLVYALVFTTTMYRCARSSIGGLRWPKNINAQMRNPYQENISNRVLAHPGKISNFHGRTLYLVFIFTLGGLFKHALTEADKICLSALVSYYDQGVYALASSYGGLAARLLLQPIEENSRLLFSRQGALIEQKTCRESKGEENEIEKLRATCNTLDSLEETYVCLVRVVLYVGLLFAAIASNYSAILLRILAGKRWGSNLEASAALSAFCVMTAFLALNGTTEAFVYGIARSGRDVGKIGVAHAVVGGVFAFIAPSLVKSHGALGLVAANCISMMMRSMYSLNFARGYFVQAVGHGGRTSILFRILPNGIVLIAFGTSFVLTRLSAQACDAQIANGKNWVLAGAQHIGVGVFSVVVTAVLTCWLEREIRGAIMTLVKQNGKR